MFDTVLIANRGEIALRIQRACRGLGLRTVAVYSEADRDAVYVRQADQALCIGPASPTSSYLNQAALLAAARVSGAQAIHPGYGFLSENAGFVARLALTLSPIVRMQSALADALALTREEARRAFGNPEVYIEKFLTHPRHVEIQVLADRYGHAVWLGSRDCSLQRRHQKVIEEAPAPGIDASLIAEVGERCAAACRQIGYCGVGTFEFLYENGAFYFIEMNTRLQVEHPVTEMTSGIDIVQQQIRVARGEPLTLRQGDIACRGHALECRINAEHPDTFMPSPGVITGWQLPGGYGVRVDTHAGAGYRVPSHYDSMIAKLIVHGASREDALQRMRLALDELQVDGIATNLPLHREIVRDAEFETGGVDIHHLERWLRARAELRSQVA
ncbi:acetyl-CoA carboxylase biotin carboxylase subunit [Ralstonia solanacearum]|nr:acetyl-CoA carboxylase biotin carboxylase subunit [Ralstonia solanacearum]NKF71616.1 acetyl-CoA carboxylase biotin carboxylase subunit [Ralstonia solanacearum]